MGRIGGFERDFNDIVFEKTRRFLREFPPVWQEFEDLLLRNRIFMDRTMETGAITAERALNYGMTGPNLRACGLDYDLRVHEPYCSYEDFDFQIPIGTTGDTYDRFVVRNEEIRQSLSIIQQALQRIESMEKVFHAEEEHYYLPPKQEVYRNMEALIYHFKIIMGEIDPPVGEVYHAVEGANGELGFYLVSDGGRTPFRLHFRRPCFIYYQAFPEMVRGQLLSDAIVVMSSLNVIAGELDA
jgi:NADH-quinone oxidoreductase subunit D